MDEPLIEKNMPEKKTCSLLTRRAGNYPKSKMLQERVVIDLYGYSGKIVHQIKLKCSRKV